MYKNVIVILAGCLACLGLFFATFQQSARQRADYVWNNGTEPQNLDPGIISGQPEGEIAIGLFEGLTAYHPETLDPMPAIAQTWQIDGLKYTFQLRPDAWWVKGESIFAVDGKKRHVTAQDFVYSWRRHLLPETGSEYSYLLHHIAGTREFEEAVRAQWEALSKRYEKENPDIVMNKVYNLLPADRKEVEAFRDKEWNRIVGIKANGELELEITLQSPAPYFLALTSFYPFFPVPREAVEEHGERWVLPQNIVTSGPYLLDEWKFNSFVRLRKNPNYWETEAFAKRRIAELQAKSTRGREEEQELQLLRRYGSFEAKGLRTMEALAVEDRNTSLNLYINGDIDRDREIPSEVVKDLLEEAQKDHSTFKHVHHGVMQTVYFFSINTKLPVFQGEKGRKLRRALSLCIDRQGVVNVVTRAHQKPAFRLVPPGIQGYSGTPLFGNGDYQKDKAEAKRIVEELRTGGMRIPPLTILYNTHQGHEKIAAFLQNGWSRDLEIETKTQNQEWGVFLDTRRTGAFDIARSAWIADYPDPNTFLDMFTTGNQNNDPKYSQPLYDRLITQYCARILDHMRTKESREQVLADIEAWPEWKEVSKTRRLADGQLLGEAIRNALTAEPPSEDSAKLDEATRARLLLFEVAEEILLHDMPIIPLYFYTTTQIWPPQLEGMALNARDSHPLKWLRWQGGERPTGSRYADFPRVPTRLPPEPIADRGGSP
ncbi:MAG: peptide ABC transporter substrate-binding protein [Planctomycetota bacterium]